jgi:hypothetical protein
MRGDITSEEEQLPCEATSVEGFIQQLAVCILRHGYFWYVTGVIPEVKDPRVIDGKISRVYGLNVSKWVRARRKQAGHANLRYLRHERFFVLAATRGEHHFYRDEAGQIRDARVHPIRYRGYAVSHRGGHPHVRIENAVYLRLKARFLDIAVRSSVDYLAWEFGRLPFEPYAPIRSQLLALLRAVNKARATVGLEPVPSHCLRLKRRIVRPFAWKEDEAAESEHGDGEA